MKHAILFVTLGVTLAGVASASVFTTSSPNVTRQPQLREGAAPAKPIVPPDLPTGTAAKAVPVEPVVRKASVDTRQSPVPLQARHRPAVNLPAADNQATEAKPPEAGGQQEAAAEGDSFNEKAAKAAIEADGYKGVTVLRKGVNGVWHASALRGKTTVMLTVDPSGSVTSD